MTAISMPIGVADNGNPPKFWIAHIKYENVDGCHIFTSSNIEGLMVASRDAQKALRQIRPTVESLIEKNTGAACTVHLGEEFKMFEKKHKNTKLAMKDTYAVISHAA